MPRRGFTVKKNWDNPRGACDARRGSRTRSGPDWFGHSAARHRAEIAATSVFGASERASTLSEREV